MTKLTKRIVRETSSHIRGKGSKRPLVVVLEPGGETDIDRIVLVEKGRRHSSGYSMPISTLFGVMAKAEADETASRRAAERRGRTLGRTVKRFGLL